MTNPGFAVALLLVTLGGLLTGAFAAPMKYLRRWRWENIWSAYSPFALVVILPPARPETRLRLSPISTAPRGTPGGCASGCS